jgi:aspartyl-tRNA(Asn)/glutamyl-tRNA(Gln) amidotransferase subunit C
MPPPSAIDHDRVRHIARLARLKLDDDEVERMTKQLAAIVDYVAELQSVDVEGVEATEHAGLEALRLRDDTPHRSTARDTVMDQAPEVDQGAFVVPPFVDANDGANEGAN